MMMGFIVNKNKIYAFKDLKIHEKTHTLTLINDIIDYS
jgi:hypothetical protein